jgi:hypothetical protein
VATLTADQLADLRTDAGIENSLTVIVTGDPTGGTFTLTYSGQTTSALAYNADGDLVQAALQALSNVGAGGAIVTGAEGGPWQVYIDRHDGTLLTATNNLTGGTSPAFRISLNAIMSDTALNRAFTRATADYPDNAYNVTVVYVLLQRLADLHKRPVYTTGSDGLLNKQRVFENAEKLLERWEKIAGLDGSSISAGSMSLGLDTTEDDLLEEWQS